ncbi:uncharacterized protein BN805_00891 [Prevotella sp. CAG:891]|nr:uncharacterized protein BN805_00891 [Prevotella sp. CAG:891]
MSQHSRERQPFEYLEFLHGVIGQILEQDTLISAKKTACTECYFIQLTSTDKNFAVGIDCSPRQLLNEVCKHRTIGHFEGACIINQRVAPHFKFNTCGTNHGLAQLLHTRTPVHLNKTWHAYHPLARTHRERLPHIGIPLLRCTQQVVAGRSHGVYIEKATVVVDLNIFGSVSFNFNAICRENLQMAIFHASLKKVS